MNLVSVAGVVGFLGVALGAFGAHALRARLDPAALEIYRTGVLYHLVHAAALLAVALLAPRAPAARVAGALLVGGIVVFSGSLYLLAVTGVKWLGAVTPFGGAALLAGWLALVVAGRRAP